MGLDWNPIGKPKPGHEDESEKLFYMLGDSTVSTGWFANFKKLFSRFDREATTIRWFEM